MNDILDSPKLRLRMANDQIVELQREIAFFLAKKPYACIIERDAKSGNELYKIRFAEPFPNKFTRDTIQIAESLRAALDYLGYSTAILAGHHGPKSTHFPIADTLIQLENDVIKRGKCKDIPPDIVMLFRGFKPYKGGNDLIWCINKIANSTKHRLVVPVAAKSGTNVKVQRMIVKGSLTLGGITSAGTSFGSLWNPVKNEITFASFSPGTQLEGNIAISLDITFGKIEAVNGKQLTGVFRAMSGEVERIILATEAECRRIGLR